MKRDIEELNREVQFVKSMMDELGTNNIKDIKCDDYSGSLYDSYVSSYNYIIEDDIIYQYLIDEYALDLDKLFNIKSNKQSTKKNSSVVVNQDHVDFSQPDIEGSYHFKNCSLENNLAAVDFVIDRLLAKYGKMQVDKNVYKEPFTGNLNENGCNTILSVHYLNPALLSEDTKTVGQSIREYLQYGHTK